MNHAIGVLVAFLLAAGSAMAADPLNFYVGFTGVQTLTVPAGQIRYVNVLVGSNEDTSRAEPYTIFFQLGARGADGTVVCNTGVELLTKVRPAVQPLRFQIFYPSKPTPKKTRAQYKLTAKIEVRVPGTAQVLERESSEVSYQFPADGTPSCEILIKP